MLKQDSGVYACIAEDDVRYNLGEVRRYSLFEGGQMVRQLTPGDTTAHRERVACPPHSVPQPTTSLMPPSTHPPPTPHPHPHQKVKEELMAAMGLNTEAEGSLGAFLRRGYKTSTWFEDSAALEQSKEWRM
jgi:hypothetical protein